MPYSQLNHVIKVQMTILLQLTGRHHRCDIGQINEGIMGEISYAASGINASQIMGIL